MVQLKTQFAGASTVWDKLAGSHEKLTLREHACVRSFCTSQVIPLTSPDLSSVMFTFFTLNDFLGDCYTLCRNRSEIIFKTPRNLTEAFSENPFFL